MLRSVDVISPSDDLTIWRRNYCMQVQVDLDKQKLGRIYPDRFISADGTEHIFERNINDRP